jgi:hypothetical protein
VEAKQTVFSYFIFFPLISITTYIIVDLCSAGWHLSFTPSILTGCGKFKILLSNQIKSDSLTAEILSKGEI